MGNPHGLVRMLFLVIATGFSLITAAATDTGDIAPRGDITLVDGTTLSSEALEGKVVLTVFWATWCHICMRELPEFQKLRDRHRAAGFEVLALSVDRDVESVRDYLRDSGLSFPVAMRTDELKSAWGPVQGTPLLYLTDRAGIVRLRHLGAMEAAALEERVTELLAAPASGR